MDVFMTPYERQVLQYALDSYYFAMYYNSGIHTFDEFANEIEKVYDISEPRNAEVCRILRKYPEIKHDFYGF